ncbi:hypothetical protein OSTOST_23351, partial [Ostertagia ostertagi]
MKKLMSSEKSSEAVTMRTLLQKSRPTKCVSLEMLKKKMDTGSESECNRLLRSVPTTRHVFHKHFEKFTNWMTDDQRRTMSDMRDSGKSFEELRQKTYEYFDTLPEERQQSVRESYKGQCQPCAEMLAKKTRTKRDIDEKINKRLSWMTADQKTKVKQMYADGKPQAEIRAKIFEYLSELEGPA